MYNFFVALHVTAISLVVGTLFLQSLTIVMALRLKSDAQREGQQILQQRIHWFIYYPILAVALATGLGLALASDAFHQGRWLHWNQRANAGAGSTRRIRSASTSERERKSSPSGSHAAGTFTSCPK